MPSLIQGKKEMNHKEVILVNAGSAQVPFLLKRWNEEVFLFTVCLFSETGSHMKPRLILCSCYSSCLFLRHHARQGWVVLWVNICVFVSGPWQVSSSSLCHCCYHYFCWYFVCISQGVQGGSLACIYDCTIYMLPHASSNLWRSEQDVRSVRTGIRSGCGPLCGCWKLSSGALEEQPVLLTSEPSLQPFCLIFEAGSLIETGDSVSFRDLHISASQLWVCRCMPGFLHER